MVWTRRRLLTTLSLAAASGGTLLSGCATTVTGDPVGVARSTRGAGPTSSRRRGPRFRSPVNVAVPQGEPYAFKDGSGELTGQTVRIVQAVFKKLDVDEVAFTQIQFDEFVPSVMTNRVDLAGGFYLTKGQCQGLTGSKPDHLGLTGFAVPPGNPKGITSFADITAQGTTVAVMTGLPEDQYATKALPASQVVRFPTPIEMLEAVGAGRADCAAFPDLGLRSLIKAGIGGNLEVTEPTVLGGVDLPVSAYVFGPDTDRELISAFDGELVKLQKSGEWLALAEPFGFTAAHLPGDDLAPEDYCGG